MNQARRYLSQTFNQHGSGNPLASDQPYVVSIGRDCQVVNLFVSEVRDEARTIIVQRLTPQGNLSPTFRSVRMPVDKLPPPRLGSRRSFQVKPSRVFVALPNENRSNGRRV